MSRLLLEASPSAVLVGDGRGRIVLANRAAADLFGYELEQLVGLDVDELLPERFRGPHRDRRARYAEDPSVRPAGESLLVTGRRRDGREFPVEIGLAPIVVSERRLVVAYCQDLSARHALEAERSRALEREATMAEQLAAIVETSPDAVIGRTFDGIVTSWNPAAERLFGRTADEMIGSSVDVVVAPERRHEVAEIDQVVRSGRVVDQFETERLHRDGTVLHVSVSLGPLRDESGSPIGVAGFIRDIGERKRLEAQLEHAQRLESVGRLAGGVAHDFNNLLTVIGGYAESLLHDELPEGVQPQVVEIAVAARRAADLTRQLLAFSRRQVLRPRVVDLNELISGILPMLHRLIGEDVQLVATLEPALHPLFADPGQIEQVVTNLVVNARDAMPSGGRLTIETRNLEVGPESATHRAWPGSYCVLVVNDTGIGMDADTLEHAFDPFFTTKAAGQGTGLGLAMVYGVVKQSGGDIQVSSEPGRGTTFEIRFPKADGTAVERSDLAADAHSAAGSEVVLVVEDEEALRRFVARTLEEVGYRVLEASGPTEAVELLAAYGTEVDLLLTDVVMPDYDGVELSRRLSATRPGLRTVFMSGYPGRPLAGPAIDESRSGFLEKPFSRAALARKVRETLDGERS